MLAFAGVFLLVACNGERAVSTTDALNDISDEAWSEFASKRIFFGHQSVGHNMMAGVEAVLAERSGWDLNIVESHDPEVFGGPVFAHSAVGMNTQPLTKIHEFAEFMDGGIGGVADIAFLKLCYVDTDADTDVDALFGEYASSVAKLQETYPETRFVHLTMPLTTVQTGPRATLKKLLGRPATGLRENLRREQYNQMIRQAYGDEGLVFDIAGIESDAGDGAGRTFEYEGENVPALNEAYTTDGGHLNAAGQALVGQKLLRFLVDVSTRDQESDGSEGTSGG
jgi:hypothetical protein